MKAGAFRVVGIGASAGGLEAVSKLLSCLPADTGMAFVVVQHLDPARESFLPAILQKATAMRVAQAAAGTRVEPDRVYVIPPNAHMRLAAGRLRLSPRPPGVHAMSVDCFLASLAESRGAAAVAVILSGTASDGALGAKAVKAEGGVVFAQDEGSAAHAGMPQSAQATGAVDFVLPPEGIAAELTRLARQAPPEEQAAPLLGDAEGLARIIALLRRATGVDFGLYKLNTIRRRLARRLALLRVDSLERYAGLLEKDPAEARALHDELLIHVTHFFREPAALAALRRKAFPRILKGLPPDADLRVWVPGCSSGEEAYTTAIELLDFLGQRGGMRGLQVFGTDISEAALEKARAGVYPEGIARHVPRRYLRRFFTRVERGYQISKQVRDLCVFAKHDLTKDPPFANLDLISCCNVLIYLESAAQRRLLPMFHYALRPWGALLLSSSESVGESGDLFAAAAKRVRLYFKKPAAANVRFPARPPAPPAEAAGAPRPKAAAPAELADSDVLKAAERLLLARFVPACVIVDADLEVLHFRGRVSRYLEPATGRASLALLRMVPAHAAGALRALAAKARRSDAPARAAGLDLDAPGGARVDVEVVPFHLPVSGQRYYLVLLEDAQPAGRAKAARGAGPRETAPLRRLKAELTSTRSYLQTIVEEHEAAQEELKSANEEIVSSNEELQSTNEELEIAKEELQAANEELTTLNEELQNRNADLGQLNNDLSNLLSSIHLPIVMVSTDLRIRRFTPMAERVMSLAPGDVGRSIGAVKLRVALPNIEDIILDVIETTSVRELDVRDPDGRSFAVRVRPYRTTENRIDGAVVVFVESDPAVRAAPEVKPASAFEAALDMVRDPMAVLDAGLRVRAVSRSMYQAFGLSPGEPGRPLFELEEGRWDVPVLRAAVEGLLARGTAFRGLPARVAGRALSFSARRIEGGAGAPQLLLTINEEAQDRDAA